MTVSTNVDRGTPHAPEDAPLRRGHLVAPFPWFGGKSRVAPEIWKRFGDTPNYVEPFAGSLATMLGRPDTHKRRTETVNDLDGFIVNWWRAIVADPDQVAGHADWPVSEADLHARHVYLVQHRGDLTARLCGDPGYFDAQIAGWWVWGICAWIGRGFCSGRGPWTAVDGRLRLARTGQGINRQLPHLGNAGQGINRQLPHLGDAGQGINRQLPHLGDAGQGITAWFATLSARLRRARIACGDWTRVLGDSVTTRHGVTGVFLDPPYGEEIEQTRVYACDDGAVSSQVRDWCAANGDNPLLRIALCGYAGGGHEALERNGWTVHEWTARGGYIGASSGGVGDSNRQRERVWFSPHCIEPAGAQLDLFAEVTS